MTVMIEEAGVPIKYHHHEVGSTGQSEIETRFMELAQAGDSVLKMKYIIKNLAKANNKSVTFMPKPIHNEAGNGMHFHQYLRNGDSPIFYDENGYENLHRKETYFDLSETAMYYIGGILKHGKALLAFTNPSTNSYKRLVPGFEAPTNLFFSLANRSAAIRIPKSATSAESKRIEFRPPDATCNPYLAMAAMLMAGLDGIRNKIDPTNPEFGFGPFDDNIFNWSDEQKQKLSPVPTSLEEALLALKEDNDFLCEGEVFSRELIDKWIETKMKDVDVFRRRPHPYEVELYYNV
jgi:glutamine synthetase